MLDLLLQEVSKIQAPDIREYIYKIVTAAPINSWKLPSSRDHHLRDECGEWGNLIHTVRVIRIADILAEILDLPQIDRDVLRGAASIHDVCKHGVDAEAVFIYREHPQLVKQLIQKLDLELYPRINSCVEQHMGRWGSVPIDWGSGEITIALLLHLADCIEARLPGLKVPKVGGNNA